MIKKISEEPKRYIHTFFGTKKNWWEQNETWQIECDLCKTRQEFIIQTYNYGGWGSSGWLGWYPLYQHGFKMFSYGKYNKRTLHFCATHKDQEIQSKIEELI